MLEKAELRRLMRQRRADCDPALGTRLTGNLLAAGLIRPGAVICGFWPLAGEIDCLAMMVALVGRGHAVGLPLTPPLGSALTFAQWRPGSVMRPGRFGTVEPSGQLITPTILLVPLLAFDRTGRRLGYGGGYYDRTIRQLGAGTFTIGCGFAMQEVDRVPTETHDRMLDAVATEAGVIVVE